MSPRDDACIDALRILLDRVFVKPWALIEQEFKITVAKKKGGVRGTQ